MKDLSLTFFLCLFFSFTAKAQFAPPVSVYQSPVYEPKFLDTADFDLDGTPDMLITNSDWHLVISWDVQSGAEELTSPFDNSYQFNSAIITDVNQDGLPDIVGAVRNTTGFLYWKNLGDKTFELVNIDPAANFLTAADMNADGQPEVIYEIDEDLYVAHFGPNDLLVDVELVQEDLSPSVAEVMDFDGNGNLDVIIDNEYRLFLPNNDLILDELAQTIQLSEPSYFDLDGDGDIDVLGKDDYYDELFVLKVQDSAGQFSEVASFAIPDLDYRGAVSFDLDGDGEKDLLTYGYYEPTYFMKGLGGFAFADAQQLKGLMVHNTKWQDLNGDGNEQLVFSSEAVSAVYTIVPGSDIYELELDYILGPYPQRFSDLAIIQPEADELPFVIAAQGYLTDLFGLALDDQNNIELQVQYNADLQFTFALAEAKIDGQHYLFASDYTQVYRFLIDENHRPVEPMLLGQIPEDAFAIAQMLPFDLNEDGILDLLLEGDDANLYWLQGLGNGDFTSNPELIDIDDLQYSQPLVSANFLGTDQLQLFFVSDKQIKYLSAEEGYLDSDPITIPNPPGFDMISFVMADINADGLDDILALAANSSTDQIKIMQYFSNQTLGWNVFGDWSAMPLGATAADVNNDGLIDIITVLEDEIGDMSIEVYQNLGADGFVNTQSLETTITYPSFILFDIADYDMDGDVDILVRSFSIAEMEYLQNFSADNASSLHSPESQKPLCTFDVSRQQLRLPASQHFSSLELFDLQGRRLYQNSHIKGTIDLQSIDLPPNNLIYKVQAKDFECSGLIPVFD